MKRLLVLIIGCLGLQYSFAQPAILPVATDKTVSLVFPFQVLHIDRGSNAIIVQPVKEADNIILVKAASSLLKETSLSVITADGSVYSFRVNYTVDPPTWIWQLPVQRSATTATYAMSILDNPKTMRGGQDASGAVEVLITGIYIHDQVLFYQLRLNNHSPIDYDLEGLQFSIRDKNKGKRTAVQENVQVPLYVAGNITLVKAFTHNTAVVALEKFTIPDAKYLFMQVIEHNGGRHLGVKINNRKILRAIPLPNLH